jgi:rhodanese-related sulfurtransferase
MRYLILILVVISVQLTFVSCSNSQTSEEAEKQEEVDYSKTFLLDVRTPSEYSVDALEGSVNIPLNELENNVDQIPKDNLILVYCASGNRATKAIQILEENGYTNLKNGINGSNVKQLLNNE